MRKVMLVLGCLLLMSFILVGCGAAESSLNQETWNSSPTTSSAVIQNTAALTAPTPTSTIRLNETVTLTSGSTFGIAPINNPAAPITVNRTSALGALDAAATKGGLTYTVKTTDWGPFINSIGDYTYNETTYDSWLYMVDGVTAEVGAADYSLNDGDQVTYWYGAWGSSPATSPAVVTIDVAVPTPTPTPTEQNLPVANFTVTSQGGAGSMGVLVTTTAVNATSVHYDLGDGTTTAYPTFTYTYWQPGTYTINQTATNAAGSTCRAILVTVPAVLTPTLTTSTPTMTTVAPTSTMTGMPYNGPHTIPGILQAEDYDLGGEGITYHDTTPGNEGGIYRHDDVDIEANPAEGSPCVGWIRNGEYLTYTVAVQSTGTYTLAARAASPNSGRTATLSVDGTPAVTIVVPNTGSFTTYKTISIPVALTAGTHTLKVTFSGDGQNLDWLEFTKGGSTMMAQPPTVPEGSAVRFTLTPASGKTIAAAWWTFDSVGHYSTWNSRAIDPTFYYPVRGIFSPLVKITYTDGSTETIGHPGYIQVT